MRHALILFLLCTLPAAADSLTGPLAGKSFIVEMSSSQYASGYGAYLLPPLMQVLSTSGMRAQGGPGADVVVNVVTDSDVGQWVKRGGEEVWLYTIAATVGISPESYVIPIEGTPVFGVKASLMTSNPDRQREWDCLIKLAARAALQNYRPEGLLAVDGQGCSRER
jgi:hypothetical protein